MIQILIVDDEKIIRERLKNILTLDNYKVFTAETGAKGLAICQKEKIEIALIDLRMPDIDGIKVLREIKKKSKLTEVIIITGHGGIKTAIEALKEGSFRYMQKPIDYDELAIHIKAALTKQKQQKKMDAYVRDLEKAINEKNKELKLREKAEKALKQFSRQKLYAREEEKKKLSIRLHNEIGSFMVDTTSAILLIEEDIRNNAKNLDIVEIAQTKMKIKKMAEKLRDICIEIRPPDINMIGLKGAISELIGRVSETKREIYFDVDLPSEENIKDWGKMIIYRIVQESLNNALKHAKAENIKIFVKRDNDKVNILIADDVIGFDINKMQKKASRRLGLKIMKEEAESLGAPLLIDSRPGHGTSIKTAFTVKALQTEENYAY